MNEQKNIDLSSLSASEMRAELERREAAEKKEKEAVIKQFETDKETFVNDTVSEFKRLREVLKTVKHTAILNGKKLHDRMWEVYGKEAKEQKQFTLTNKKKTAKIVVDNSEKMGFSEESVVAIQAIKDFFKGKFENRSKLIYSLLDALLIKNSAGDYDPKLLTKLRDQVKEINDPELSKHYQLLVDSQVVTGTALYLRVYEVNKNGKMRDIVIQFSAL